MEKSLLVMSELELRTVLMELTEQYKKQSAAARWTRRDMAKVQAILEEKVTK